MNREHNIGYDIIRILAISAVVIIHCNSSFLWETDASEISALLMLQLTALCIVAVPLFFMVSGALLLDVKEPVSLKELFMIRIKKQAIPFVLWSLIYVVTRIIMGKVEFKIITFVSLLYEPAYAQFWFMYTLFAIYLLLPILQVLILNIKKKQYHYLLLLWGIFSSLIPVLTIYIPSFSISSHVDLILCEGYIGFFLLGYYLKKYGTGISKKTSLLVGVAGIMITAVSVCVEWFYTGNEKAICAGQAYGNYLFPGAIIGSAGIFVFLQNYKWKEKERVQIWLKKLATKTLGVYYVHMFILVILEWTILRNSGNVYVTLLKTILTLFLSFGVATLLSYVPIINILVGGKCKEQKRVIESGV